ncbi:MAG: hypothetical protein HXY34_05650 [Candidatus Thorarchaeota archaeon]|nr:hypothetical protein [Candidatus Thorarchaeota archaeon]
MGVRNWSELISWTWADCTLVRPRTIAFDTPNYMLRRLSTRGAISGPRIALDHVFIFLSIVRSCLRVGLLPVFVFDGPPETLKRPSNPALVSRAEKLYSDFRESGDSYDDAISEALSDSRALRWYFSVAHLRDLCVWTGVPAVSSPTEAEMMAARLAADGMVGTVVSNDADALLFGSHHVTRALHLSESSVECATLAQLQSSTGLNMSQLRDLAVLCGCDFHPGLRGIGPRRGVIELRRHGDLEAVLKARGVAEDERVSYRKARDVYDEVDFLSTDGVDLSVRSPVASRLEDLLRSVTGTDRASHMVKELMVLWKGSGVEQTHLEEWM